MLHRKKSREGIGTNVHMYIFLYYTIHIPNFALKKITIALKPPGLESQLRIKEMDNAYGQYFYKILLKLHQLKLITSMNNAIKNSFWPENYQQSSIFHSPKPFKIRMIYTWNSLVSLHYSKIYKCVLIYQHKM